MFLKFQIKYIMPMGTQVANYTKRSHIIDRPNITI